MKWEKEEFMTSVVTNIKDIIETEDIKTNCPTPKSDAILDFIWLKILSNKYKEEINKYTERSKKVRNGKRVLLGTRITPEELLLIMAENREEADIFEYISKQYPSIDSEEKLLFGALAGIKRKNTLLFILTVLING